MPPTYSRRADHLTTTCRHYQACNASVPEPHYSSGQLRRGSFNRESPSIHTRLPRQSGGGRGLGADTGSEELGGLIARACVCRSS